MDMTVTWSKSDSDYNRNLMACKLEPKMQIHSLKTLEEAEHQGRAHEILAKSV